MVHKDQQISQMVEAARLYYEHDYSQQEIAKKLGISRPGVSRLLQKAREKGIVRIEIHDPTRAGTRLESQLVQRFGLKKCIVVPSHKDSNIIKKRLGAATGRLLDELITENVILGVSWGTTMHQVALQLREKITRNVTVVQLNGGVSRAEIDTRATEITRIIGEKLHARSFLLPLPAIVENAEVKKAILEDNNIASILDMGCEAQIAVFTVGAFGYESILVKADYFKKEEVAGLLEKGAVGDICSRIIDREGKICSPELDQRTIGITLSELKQKEYSICVAGGKEKLSAIKAGLQGKFFNILVTDEWIAEMLLYDQENQR